jgi:hypothetical protein
MSRARDLPCRRDGFGLRGLQLEKLCEPQRLAISHQARDSCSAGGRHLDTTGRTKPRIANCHVYGTRLNTLDHWLGTLEAIIEIYNLRWLSDHPSLAGGLAQIETIVERLREQCASKE